MGLIAAFIRFFLSPFRALARLVGAGPARTVEKSGAGYVAKGAGEGNFAEEKGGEPDGASFLFKRLARPMLVERTAADMTLEEAQEVSAEAAKFYTYPFPLFARADAFYEEIEQDYINAVLGRAEGSADAPFLSIMDRFRRELNANTALLFLVYTPVMLALTIGAALAARALVSPAVEGAAAASAVVAVSLALLMLLYHWPYKVTQQQNLLGLDNYITSKFSRINQNFQVAKRRAMNVERNMRMPQAEQLKAEAGVWTVSYQWFAMRLLFCEMTVRNTLYQIRRNTTLYGVAGMAVSALLAGALAFGASSLGAATWWEVAGAGAVFTAIAYLVIMRHATRETLSVLQPTEWNRFHLVDLHETVRDHVGEDKLQIVTFRDRNRLE
jgi:membrane protein implicated in regulation of membrane protease activity